MRPVAEPTPAGEWAVPPAPALATDVTPVEISDGPTNRWTAEERREAQAQTTFEPLAPVLEPKRKPVPDETEPGAVLDETGTSASAAAPVVSDADVTTAPGPAAAAASFAEERDTLPPVRARPPMPPPAPPTPELTPVVVRSREVEEPVESTLVVRRPDAEPPAAEGEPAPPAGDTGPTDVALKKKRSLLRTAVSWTLRAGIAVTAFTLGYGYIEYRSIRSELPPLDKIKNYRPPIVTEVRAADGTVLGKFYEEERYVVELQDVRSDHTSPNGRTVADQTGEPARMTTIATTVLDRLPQ